MCNNNLVDQIINSYLPGYSRASADDKDRIWDAASVETIFQMNAELQKVNGRGVDFLSVNEFSRSGHVCDYGDLLSYDVKYVAEQSAYFAEYTEEHEEPSKEPVRPLATPRPDRVTRAPLGYISGFTGEWIRLYFEGDFVYGNLFTADHFVMMQADEIVESWLNQRYYYQLQMNSYLTDELANGEHLYQTEFTCSHPENEKKCSEARHTLLTIKGDIEEQLRESLNQQTPATYIMERKDHDGFPMIDFVCRNNQALSLIRPDHFVEDMKCIQANESHLEYLSNITAKEMINALIDAGF